jgi:hypothetical protein
MMVERTAIGTVRQSEWSDLKLPLENPLPTRGDDQPRLLVPADTCAIHR